jgi:uncharacterized protein
MATQIFVNLPVKDLDRTMEFFKRLDFAFDPRFTNQDAACMIAGENIYVMLLVDAFFLTFTKKALCNTATSIESIVCLSVESRARVDELIARAVAAGAAVPRAPQDYGFMYGHSFEDLDGHLWELVYMEPDAEVHP